MLISMLPGSSYRKIERRYGERGKYVLSRVSPLAERIIFTGGALTAFIYCSALDKYRKGKEIESNLEKEAENFELPKESLLLP